MPEADERASIRAGVLSGFAWKLVSQVTLQIARFAGGITLARFIAPVDYGRAGMALVFSSLVLVFADMAFGSTLVQRESVSERDRSTVFWLSLIGGCIFGSAGYLLAGSAARLYGRDDVTPLLQALALTFPLAALGTVPAAMLGRSLDFRRLELRQIASSLIGIAAAVVVATRGGGAWAIVVQQIASVASSTVILFALSRWLPRHGVSLASARALAGFSGNVVLQRLLYYLHRNADNVLVGRYLGASALGAYTLAYNIMLIPFNRISGVVQEVLFPAFARMQAEPRRIADLWLRSTRVVGTLSVPALLGLIVVAPDFVPVVLGPRWIGATTVLQVLSWVGLMQSLQTSTTDVMLAVDRSELVRSYSVGFFCAHLVAFVIGVQYGIVGVAVAYAISSTVVEPLQTVLACRALGVSARGYFVGLRGVAEVGLLMLATVLAARLVLLDATSLGPAARLVICSLLGMAATTVLVLWRVPEVMHEVRDLRRRRSER